MTIYPMRQRRVSLQTKQCTALILAGGRGPRLSPMTDSRAEPAIAFAGKYRLIDFTLSNCMNSGIRAVAVATQYMPYDLIEHCQLTWGWTRHVFGDFVSPFPAYQGPGEEGWYKGTADAIYQNLSTLEATAFKYVLVLSGDHIYKMDYGEMLASHINSEADISVGIVNVPKEHGSRYGVVELDDQNRITRFLEKPSDPPVNPEKPDRVLASMGIYIFSLDLLKQLLHENHARADTSHDLAKDILVPACEKLNVQGYRFEDIESGVQRYWRDVGTLDAYYAANMDLISVDPDLDLYDNSWPIWSYQQPQPGAKFLFNDGDNGHGIAHNSLVSAGDVVAGKVEHSLLFTSVTVGRRAHVENCLVLDDCDIGEGCLVRNAIIDEGCQVPNGLNIGVDPEQDRARFHVTDSGLIVVTPKMLRELE